jgi:hypothetical protein
MSFPSFSAGEVLTAADMNAVGLWLVKTQTVGTGVASVTVTDAFNANFDHYRVIYQGGVGSTAQAMVMTLGASTTGYYAGYLSVLYGSDTLGYVRNNNSASWDIGGSYPNGNSLDVTLFNPQKAVRTGMNNMGRIDYRTAGAAHTSGSGIHDSATAFTSFTLTVTGTMTGGTIRVYGLRN